MTRASNALALASIVCASLAFAAEAPSVPPDSTLERDIQIARTLTEATRQATVAAVARAMQTEQKLDAMQQFTLARTVPLVPPAGN